MIRDEKNNELMLKMLNKNILICYLLNINNHFRFVI